VKELQKHSMVGLASFVTSIVPAVMGIVFSSVTILVTGSLVLIGAMM